MQPDPERCSNEEDPSPGMPRRTMSQSGLALIEAKTVNDVVLRAALER